MPLSPDVQVLEYFIGIPEKTLRLMEFSWTVY
jgi:hypothetical protein